MFKRWTKVVLWTGLCHPSAPDYKKIEGRERAAGGNVRNSKRCSTGGCSRPETAPAGAKSRALQHAFLETHDGYADISAMVQNQSDGVGCTETAGSAADCHD